MAKPTPGPWFHGSHTVRAQETEDRLGFECRIFTGNGDDARANARLIAAAPDLLETLEQLDALGGLGQTAHRMIRAAIAKATGRPA